MLYVISCFEEIKIDDKWTDLDHFEHINIDRIWDYFMAFFHKSVIVS